MPNERELPEGLKELAFRQAMTVRPLSDFGSDMERVLQTVEAAAGYRRGRQVLVALDLSWQRGDWVTASRALEAALADPAIRKTPLYKKLLTRRETAIRRASAATAFEDSYFRQGLSELECLGEEEHTVDIIRTKRMAEIGVRVAEAIDSGDTGEIKSLEREFHALKHYSKEGRIPGEAKVGGLLVQARRLQDQVWRALRTKTFDIPGSEVRQWLLLDEKNAYSISSRVELSLWDFIRDTYAGESKIHPPRATPEIPGGRIDRVFFSVTSPTIIPPASRFVLDVWAHLACQREVVIERAQQAADGEIKIQTKGPVQTTVGSFLTVGLKVEGLIVKSSSETVLWDGEIGNASFLVLVPERVVEGPRWGQATIYLDGLRVAKVHFVLQASKARSEVGPLLTRQSAISPPSRAMPGKTAERFWPASRESSKWRLILMSFLTFSASAQETAGRRSSGRRSL